MLFCSTNICLREDKQAYVWLQTSHIFKLLLLVVLCEASGWVTLRIRSQRTQRAPGSLALTDYQTARCRPPLSQQCIGVKLQNYGPNTRVVLLMVLVVG